MLNWIEQLYDLNFKNIPIRNECIIFRFSDTISKTRGKIHIIIFCIIYIKYNIYIQRLFNNKLLEYILANHS